MDNKNWTDFEKAMWDKVENIDNKLHGFQIKFYSSLLILCVSVLINFWFNK